MNKPFAILEDWVKQGRIRLSADPVVDEPKPTQTPMELLPDDLPDEELFAFAMRDVKSLGWSAVPLHNRPPMEIQAQDDEQDALRALEEFVRKGNVEIEQTAEYIEGSVHPHGRLYLDDLRSGRFSVQAHLDLHGMNQQEARFALDEFILASIRASLGCVRVIHGRGRHSLKQQPVLKESV